MMFVFSILGDGLANLFFFSTVSFILKCILSGWKKTKVSSMTFQNILCSSFPHFVGALLEYSYPQPT